MEGKIDELKGRARQAAGAITGDTSAKVKGQGEEIVGKIKQKWASFRQKVRKKV